MIPINIHPSCNCGRAQGSGSIHYTISVGIALITYYFKHISTFRIVIVICYIPTDSGSIGNIEIVVGNEGIVAVVR